MWRQEAARVHNLIIFHVRALDDGEEGRLYGRLMFISECEPFELRWSLFLSDRISRVLLLYSTNDKERVDCL